MIPRLVPEISPLDAFCDVVGVVVGIGDSGSWIDLLIGSGGYIKSEIPRSAANHFLTVNVSLKIASFLEVDIKGQNLKVAFVLERTWYDSRLGLLHLKANPSLNVLWEKTYEKIWYPRLRFENIDDSKEHSFRHLTYTIYRDLKIEPKLINPGTENVANVFKGSEHKLVRRQEYNFFGSVSTF